MTLLIALLLMAQMNMINWITVPLVIALWVIHAIRTTK